MKYMKLGFKPDAFQSDGKSIRFVATELETDITVNVGDVKFYLHKFPLLSKSPHLQRLVASIDEENSAEIDIHDIPGGAAAFEVCAKFCYNMIVTLNAYNVFSARCAAEYLEMHETVEKGNLIYKIDVFLNSSIFRSWKDSIIMLQTTKSLQAWSEGLKVVRHCIDSIASKAAVDPEEVEWSYTYNRRKLPSDENGLDPHWNGYMKQQSVPKDWWVEDLCELEMDSYKQVILAIKTKGRVSAEVVGESLKAYSYRRLPGFGMSCTHGGDVAKHWALLESIVSLLPPEAGSVSCSFLLRLLKAGSFLNCGENCKKELIKRIVYQLQDASVADLLIPAPAGESTLYDIDTVVSIVEGFFKQDHNCGRSSPQTSGELMETAIPPLVADSSKVAVAKLVDNYLAEAAKDPSLLLSKFVVLAEMVPGFLRPTYDGLYRAIDMFLKEHPDLTKSEKKNICSLMDCSKLTRNACMHAAQNYRLPLRVVVQLLFFEQVRQAGLPTGRAESLQQGNRSASYDSSRSAASTNTEDEWDRILAAGDVSSLNIVKLEGRRGNRE